MAADTGEFIILSYYFSGRMRTVFYSMDLLMLQNCVLKPDQLCMHNKRFPPNANVRNGPKTISERVLY